MAGPGRPRKIQNEAASENTIQQAQSVPAEDVTESPAIVVAQVEQQEQEPFFDTVAKLDETLEQANTPVPAHNWQPIKTVPHNGFPVKLTDDICKPGVVAFWRRTRAFANATHMWEKTGKWTRSDNDMTIDFTPTHWKDRNDP